MYVCMLLLLLLLLLLLCYYWEVRRVGVACGGYGVGCFIRTDKGVFLWVWGKPTKRKKRNEKKGRIRVCGHGNRS